MDEKDRILKALSNYTDVKLCGENEDGSVYLVSIGEVIALIDAYQKELLLKENDNVNDNGAD